MEKPGHLVLPFESQEPTNSSIVARAKHGAEHGPRSGHTQYRAKLLDCGAWSRIGKRASSNPNIGLPFLGRGEAPSEGECGVVRGQTHAYNVKILVYPLCSSR